MRPLAIACCAGFVVITSLTAVAQNAAPPPSDAGSFEVPAIRRDQKSPRWTLRYQRFRSTAVAPGPPIVFLAGGPGDAATRALRGMPRAVLDSFLTIADVIAFDQRGTGLSDPSGAMCPPGKAQPLDRPGDSTALITSMRDQLISCLPSIESRGIPVAAFTTEESADDVEDLRKALGVNQVMLWAGSYGTHLALSVARRHPTAVARMALLGVEGPDDTIKLPSNVDQTLASIDATYPGTLGHIRTLTTRLATAPWTKTLPNGIRVTVGAWDLQRRVSDTLDTVREIDALRAALDEMMTGDYSDLVRWAIPFRLAKPISVMHIAMDCASYGSAERIAAARGQVTTSVLGDAINVPLPEICDVPGLPRLGAAFRAPLVSRVPTLLIAGTFDGRTPTANAEAIRTHLSAAELIVLPGASHGLFQEPAAMAAVLRFFGQVHSSMIGVVG